MKLVNVAWGKIVRLFFNHTKAVCGQNTELLNVKSRGTYSYHCALKDNIAHYTFVCYPELVR
jgi:hypothetical protein